jgi:hypothetical protein
LATMNVTLTIGPQTVCNHSLAFKVNITGYVTNQTYSSPTDPGVANKIKAAVCMVPSNNAYSVTLLHGTFNL